MKVCSVNARQTGSIEFSMVLENVNKLSLSASEFNRFSGRQLRPGHRTASSQEDTRRGLMHFMSVSECQSAFQLASDSLTASSATCISSIELWRTHSHLISQPKGSSSCHRPARTVSKSLSLRILSCHLAALQTDAEKEKGKRDVSQDEGES